MSSGQIWLVRHGETEWSKTGQHTGRTNVELTLYGQQQARALAHAFDDVPVGLTLCSPLTRARDTAQLAGITPDEFTDDLLEWDYGAYEGITTAQIREQAGDPSWLIWDHPIPAGTAPGEQLADVSVRVDRVIARCLPVVESGRACILVSHGHLLRILTARWLGLAPIAGRLFALDPARLSALGFEHETHVLREWNATVTHPEAAHE
jgi:probable phosphoglycerate mutase